jgi:phage repressor protein C with HTH and peptisase S24 domain
MDKTTKLTIIYFNRWKNLKYLEEKLGRRELADRLGKSYNLITQYLTRKKNIGPEFACEIEEKFHKDDHWLDKDHTKSAMNFTEFPPLTDKYYGFIPLIDLESSSLDGGITMHPKEQAVMLSKEDMTKLAITEESACAMQVEGSDMFPTLNDGDKVLIDCTKKEIEDGKLYAFINDQIIQVKRFFIGPDNFIIKSDNPVKSHFPDKIVLKKEARNLLNVIGRVVMISKTGDSI